MPTFSSISRSFTERTREPSQALVSALNTRAARLVGIIAAAGIFLAEVGVTVRSVLENPWWQGSTDFGFYVTAALAVAHGQNPYDPALFSASAGDRVPYPPAFLEVLAPFAVFNTTLLRYTWLFLCIGLAVASVILVMRNFGNKVGWGWITLTLLLIFQARLIRNDLYHGQVNFLILFVLVIGLLFYVRGKGQTAGVIWALMIVIKPFLGLIVLYLLWKRAWRPAITCLLTSAGIFLASFLLTFPTGLGAFRGWLESLAVFSSPFLASRPDNVSLYGVILRLLVPNPYTAPWTVNLLLARVAQVAIIVALVLIFTFALSRRDVIAAGGPDAQQMLLVEVGFVFALGMSYGPWIENDHLFVLFPGLVGVLAIAWKRWRQSHDSTQRMLWALAAGAWTVRFAFLVSPVRVYYGLAWPDSTATITGVAILITAIPSVLLLAMAILLGAALRYEREGVLWLSAPHRGVLNAVQARLTRRRATAPA